MRHYALGVRVLLYLTIFTVLGAILYRFIKADALAPALVVTTFIVLLVEGWENKE